MRTPRSLILFFSLVVAFCGNAFSQTPVPPYSEVSNFLGKWKFVAEESFKGESDRKLYSAYMISIDRIEDKLSITREFVYNSIAYTRKATIYLDGRGETNSSADSNGRTSMVRSKSKFKKGAIHREFARETGFGPADIETFRVSEDGSRLVVERRYTPKVQGNVPESLKSRVVSDRLVLERIK